MTTSPHTPLPSRPGARPARGLPRTVALAVVLASAMFGGEVNAGRPPRPLNDPTELPEASRWTSFVQLVASRWNARLELPPSPSEARAMYRQCTEDAWHLAAPVFLRGRESPCVKLLGALPGSKASDPSPALRDRMRDHLRTASPAESHGGYRSCIREAGARRDRALLDICGVALESRAGQVARMKDKERFAAWLGGCKQTLLAEVRLEAVGDGMVAGGRGTSEAEDEHARHCLRHLSSFYEVQRIRKVSDFWTAEEQRLLFLRSQQLAGH